MMAVVLGVMTARLVMMMFGMAGVAVRGMGMVGGFFVIAGLMVLGGLAVMFRRMFVMLGGLVMMLDVLVCAHVLLPAV
jgi:hypothetical protein